MADRFVFNSIALERLERIRLGRTVATSCFEDCIELESPLAVFDRLKCPDRSRDGLEINAGDA